MKYKPGKEGLKTGRPVGNPFDKVRKEGWKNQDIEYKKQADLEKSSSSIMYAHSNSTKNLTAKKKKFDLV